VRQDTFGICFKYRHSSKFKLVIFTNFCTQRKKRRKSRK